VKLGEGEGLAEIFQGLVHVAAVFFGVGDSGQDDGIVGLQIQGFLEPCEGSVEVSAFVIEEAKIQVGAEKRGLVP
jgi:hypothetical protein